MNPRILEFIAVQVFVVIVAAAGAWTSKYVRDGGHWITYMGFGVLSTVSWCWLARRSPYDLLTSSIVWDLCYNVAWIGTTCWVLREGLSRWQMGGALVVVIGLLMMGIR